MKELRLHINFWWHRSPKDWTVDSGRELAERLASSLKERGACPEEVISDSERVSRYTSRFRCDFGGWSFFIRIHVPDPKAHGEGIGYYEVGVIQADKPRVKEWLLRRILRRRLVRTLRELCVLIDRFVRHKVGDMAVIGWYNDSRGWSHERFDIHQSPRRWPQ